MFLYFEHCNLISILMSDLNNKYKNKNMIIFNLKKLEEKLRDRPLQASQLFSYFLIYVFLMILNFNFSEESGTDKWIMVLTALISITVTIGFLIYTFNICKGFGSEDRFLELYFSLGFVVAIRFVVFVMIPLAILVSVLNSDFLDLPIPDLIFFSLLEIIYYYLLLQSFQRVLMPTKID